MAALGLEPAWLLNALTILVQLGGSLLVILNRWTWLGHLPRRSLHEGAALRSFLACLGVIP